jgi:hypothetical protein
MLPEWRDYCEAVGDARQVAGKLQVGAYSSCTLMASWFARHRLLLLEMGEGGDVRTGGVELMVLLFVCVRAVRVCPS